MTISSDAAAIAAVLAEQQVGLGMLPLAIEGRPSKRDARLTVRAALLAGVRLVDTADVYGMTGEPPGYAECVLRPFAHEAIIATKGGVVRSPDGSRLPCGRPEHLRSACEASLRRLGLEAIDLYQLHRPDPDVPYDESLGALAELAERGIVRAIGVSNVSADLVGLAHDVCGDALVAVQNALPPWSEPPDDVGNVCARLGLVLLAYGVLGGTGRAAGLATEHPTAQAMAAARGVSVQRLAVAWTLAVVPPALPIVGARRPSSIRDSAAAVKLSLARQELRALALR